MKSSILIFSCMLFLFSAVDQSFAGSTKLDLSKEKKAVEERLERIKKRRKARHENCISEGIVKVRKLSQENNIDATEKEIENYVKSECKELLE